MKSIYILLLLITAAVALGCVGKNPSEVTSTQAGTSVSPTETPASAIATPAPSGSDDFGTQSDINSMDSLVNDSNMDISLSNATI